MTKISENEQNERLARLEVFNEKVIEPSLAQILGKLDNLVSKDEYIERRTYVDGKLSNIQQSIDKINERNEKLDGNVFIKAIIVGEKKVIGLIVKWTGLAVLIGTVGFFILTQFLNSTQHTKPEAHEIIKEIREVTK